MNKYILRHLTKRFPPPLRYSIPATLFLLGGLLGLYSFQREIALSNLRNQEKAIDYARFLGDRTSGILTYLYRQDSKGVNVVISQLQDESDLQVAFVLDADDRIILSTQRKWLGLDLKNTSVKDEIAKIDQVRRTMAGQASLSKNRQSVQAIYPISLPAAPGEVLSSKVGILFIEYNQLATLQQQAWTDVLKRSFEFTIVLGLLCLTIWYFFDKILTLRASRLVEVSNRLSEGDLNVRAQLSGSDELAQISYAFDRMARMVQSKTEALQQSQVSLAQAHNDVSRQAEQLSQTLQELRATQTQLIQTEKMSSLGQLVAGIAHEINNPVNFIHGNLAPVCQYVEDLLTLLRLYHTEFPDSSPAIQALIDEIDLEFIYEDLPKTLTSMRNGTERIRQIVLTLRNFSRLDEAEMKSVNIHDGIDSTLVILQHRLKAKSNQPEVQITKSYSTLPEIECYPGQLNQVFMNILSNALDALEEKHAQDPAFVPAIDITTQVKFPDRIAIHFTDNGPGIPEAVQRRLFDPFFTTKPVGKGTGLGMSISYQIVVEKHGGSLYCKSNPQQGTAFVIEIPTCQQAG